MPQNKDNVATEILVFDFELFIGTLRARCIRFSGLGEEALKLNRILCYYISLSMQEYCLRRHLGNVG